MNDTQIKSIADAVIEALSDYPNQDPAELIDEIVELFAREEELTRAQTESLRDYVWACV